MSELKTKLFAKQPTLVPYTFLGEQVYIKRWSEREKIEWSLHIKELQKDDATDLYIRCRGLAWGLFDASGKPIFDRSDFEQIANFDAADIGKAFDAIIAQQQEPDDSKKKDSTQS